MRVVMMSHGSFSPRSVGILKKNRKNDQILWNLLDFASISANAKWQNSGGTDLFKNISIYFVLSVRVITIHNN